MTDEIFVSTDIEADGPIPGPHSMLSLASAAYAPDKTLISTFSVNLETLPGATGHPLTMEWWKKFPEAWAESRRTPRDPALAMGDYVDWLKTLPGKPVFVAYPAGFDFTFVYWYLVRFTGASPFSFACLDVKSYAMAMLGTPFHDTIKRKFPKEWFDSLPHTHVALDDAVEQGALFCNMHAANKARRAG